jgi:hypothetical protein
LILETAAGRVLTQQVNVIDGSKASIHVEFLKAMSGQLRFSGSLMASNRRTSASISCGV